MKQHSEEMALSGIRIIDLGAGAIEPMATGYLADFGAEVIKVESYGKLDFARGTELFVGPRDPDRNLSFGRYNQNKLSVLLNLKHPKGVALAKRLVSTADVVAENFTVGVIDRLGLSYEELKKVKQDIIMLSCSFAGQTGPYRGFRGQGSFIATMAGIDDITGWPDRGPVSPATALCDHYLPWLWATVILTALEFRSQTGKGQYIDGSSFEGTLDLLDTAIADFSANGRELKRRGNRHPASAPHGVYPCQGDDRWCAITIFTDEEWEKFANISGSPAWAGEERFSSLLGRLGNVDELDRLLGEWTQGQTAEDLMARLQQAGIAAGVVKNSKDIYEDPQMAHRDHYWKPPAEEDLEAFTFEAPAARLSLTPARYQRRYPLMGEHNDYVLFDLLKLSNEEYVELIEEKVIY
ncbi:MAG: CoA transferase [Chloroflexi bacterium]|nr:CoA transferase [Chloroflexota bacterium]